MKQPLKPHLTRSLKELHLPAFAQRYEHRSVLVTSNLAFSQWERIFKDPMTAAAAIDRLVHHSAILELNLPSYRMAQAQQQHGVLKHEAAENGAAAMT